MAKKKTYVADFETTTNENSSHVWAFALCDIKTPDNVIIGTTIDEFFSWCKAQKDNPTIMFHNLKFDGQFILYYLLTNGYKPVTNPKERATNTFSTLISDKGLYYTIEVYFKVKGKNVRKVTFQDSLKLIPLSVDGIAKSFKLPIQKLKIDYKAHDKLPEGSPLTEEEKEYIKHDVQIVAYAVNYFYEQGLTKMTIGSCALEEYKKLISKRAFERYYPTPKYDEDVRQSYKGGFTYLNPKFANKLVENVVVLDVNSLYPSVMYGCNGEYLPFGTPIFYNGKYEDDTLYPLYVQMISCSFELKKNKIPTIQLKNSMFFNGTEYLTSSNNEEIVMVLTNVDLELFLDHYEVLNLEYISGWKFKASSGKGLFGDYIDKWSQAKIKAKEEGNNGMYLISKLFLNSLYGKFGTATTVRGKVPYYDKEADLVKFYDTEPESKDGIYIAMASFITSWARNKTIRSAQAIQDKYYAGESNIQFIYADTDSLHCYSPNFELPQGLDIDSTKLGAWDFEAKAGACKFLRSKCYIENHFISEEEYFKGITGEEKYLYSKDEKGYYKLKITVAGMPSNCYKEVTFSNFKIGACYGGKLQPKKVKGGTILKEVEFTIKK